MSSKGELRQIKIRRRLSSVEKEQHHQSIIMKEEQKKRNLNVMRDQSTYLTINEVKKLLESAKKHSLRDYTLIFMLVTSARRVQEMLMVQRKHIRVDGTIIYSIKKKSKPTTYIELLTLKQKKVLKELINKYKLYDPEDFLFNPRNNKKKPITVRRAEQIIKRYAEESGIQVLVEKTKSGGSTYQHSKVHPHSMRHTAAKLLLKGGSTIAEVSNVLQHSDVNMTLTYTKTTPEERKQSKEKTFKTLI